MIERPSKKLFRAAAAVVVGIGITASTKADLQYWKTDGTAGTWTDANWTTDPTPPSPAGGTPYAANNDVRFTANSTVSFATTSIGNVTVDPGVTVAVTPAGTLSMNGAVRTFDIGAGSLLTWQSQTVTATSSAGITKNGAGTLDIGSLTWSTTMNGGFTLNAGTVIVVGNKSQGNGVLNLNGGTIQTSGTRDYTPTSIVIGGNFALAGTGNQNWNAATTISLGSSTRTITNNAVSGSRQFRGVISGDPGVGLTFVGLGSSTNQLYVGNTGNTFTGPLTINGTNGGEVVFNGDGALGNTTSITIDGGRLTMGVMDDAGQTTALTGATIFASKNIFVGASSGTSISTPGSTGVTTYDGVIADKPGSTGSWAKQGGGTLILGGASTYSGNTTINNGFIQLTSGNNRLPSTTALTLGQVASPNVGALDLNGRNQEVAGLNSNAGTNATPAKNTVTTFSSPATLTLSGSGTYSYGDGTTTNSGVITGPVTLVKQGSGTQTLGDTNDYTGGTFVNAGKLVVNRLHENNPVTITGGTLQVAESSPTIASGHPGGNNAFVSRPGSMITIANNGAAIGSRAYFGTLDLTNNDLVVDYDGASPIADVEDMIRAGRNGGNWLGNGITSSTAGSIAAAGAYTLGVIDNATPGITPFTTFSDQTVDTTTVLVKFVHRSDINMDGVVTFSDSVRFNGNYSEGTPTRWVFGDLNYNGVSDFGDSVLFNGGYDEALASLPEPGSLSLLGLAGAALARSRRRQHS